MQADGVVPAEETNQELPYEELEGSLFFLSNLTRPDIDFAVSKLAQFMTCYDGSHWKAAKQVLRYLRGTKTLGLRYARSEVTSEQGACLLGFRLRLGSSSAQVNEWIRVLLVSSMVSWSSQKQLIISSSLSSTEAKYIALASAAREVAWLRWLGWTLRAISLFWLWPFLPVTYPACPCEFVNHFFPFLFVIAQIIHAMNAL